MAMLLRYSSSHSSPPLLFLIFPPFRKMSSCCVPKKVGSFDFWVKDWQLLKNSDLIVSPKATLNGRDWQISVHPRGRLAPALTLTNLSDSLSRFSLRVALSAKYDTAVAMAPSTISTEDTFFQSSVLSLESKAEYRMEAMTFNGQQQQHGTLPAAGSVDDASAVVVGITLTEYFPALTESSEEIAQQQQNTYALEFLPSLSSDLGNLLRGYSSSSSSQDAACCVSADQATSSAAAAASASVAGASSSPSNSSNSGLKTSFYSDITLVAGTGDSMVEIQAHKCVLVARSSTIRAKLAKPLVQIRLAFNQNRIFFEGVSPAVLRAFVDFLYTDEPPSQQLIAEYGFGLLALAAKKNVRRLVSLVEMALLEAIKYRQKG